jgi:hypothetical protein
MRNVRIRRAMAVSLALCALIVPATVSGASAFTTMSGTFNPADGSGTFSVDSGPLQDICSGGVTQDTAHVFKETPSGHLQLVILKEFYCDEGPTFVAKLSVKIASSINFSWNVLSATDELEGMKGGGTGYADDLGDHYSGRITLP